MGHGSRRNYNYTSPKYLELSDRICTALAKHYANENQIIGWQLDNEFNCHMDVSYAPSDTMAFRRWLREKYRTLDRLNRAWGTAFWSQRYSDWDQIDLPHPTSGPPNPTQILDESRFISDTVVRFAPGRPRSCASTTGNGSSRTTACSAMSTVPIWPSSWIFSVTINIRFFETVGRGGRNGWFRPAACHFHSEFSSSNPAPADK